MLTARFLKIMPLPFPQWQGLNFFFCEVWWWVTIISHGRVVSVRFSVTLPEGDEMRTHFGSCPQGPFGRPCRIKILNLLCRDGDFYIQRGGIEILVRTHGHFCFSKLEAQSNSQNTTRLSSSCVWIIFPPFPFCMDWMSSWRAECSGIRGNWRAWVQAGSQQVRCLVQCITPSILVILTILWFLTAISWKAKRDDHWE